MTLCEIIRGGSTLAGPMSFDADLVRDIVSRQGGDHFQVPETLSGRLIIGAITIKPVTIVKPTLTRMLEIQPPVRTEDANQVTYTYGTQVRDIEVVREQLFRELSAVHDDHDMGEAMHLGVTIKTDLEARINVESVLKEFESGAITSTVWNGMDGVIAINSTSDMEVLRLTLANHMKAGFGAKSALKTLIVNGSAAELETLDIEADFNQSATSILAFLTA